MEPSTSDISDSLPTNTSSAKRQQPSSSSGLTVLDIPPSKRIKALEEYIAAIEHCVKSITAIEDKEKVATKSLSTQSITKEEEDGLLIAAPKYRLPRYMKIGTSVSMVDNPVDMQSSEFKFIAVPSTNSSAKSSSNLHTLYDTIGGGCSNIESLPLLAELEEDGYEAYMDGEGLSKDLPMNCLVNPFMEDNTLCYMAIRGGPYGAAVLFKKNGLSWKKLISLCKACDEMNDTTKWTEMLIEARDEWDALRKSLSEADD